MKDLLKEIMKMRIRIKKGAKEELLPLLKLKNIGRVRARKMFNNGVKDIGGVKKVTENNILQIEIRRHLKKKTILTKRSKAAVTKYKKSPDAASKKSIDAIAKELNLIQVALKKARASKVLVLAELVALRAATKRLSAYTRAITAADKVLNKPVVKKKRSTKKAI